MITEALATMFDVDFVLDYLSKQHKQEHQAAGLSRSDVMDRFRPLVEHGQGTTLWLNDKPAAVIGVARESNILTTWFVATPAYWKTGLKGVRHARRFIENASKNERLTTVLRGEPEPCVERWLKLIGYQRITKTGDCVLFMTS